MDLYEPTIYVGILVFAIIIAVTAVLLIIRAMIRQNDAAVEFDGVAAEDFSGQATDKKLTNCPETSKDEESAKVSNNVTELSNQPSSEITGDVDENTIEAHATNETNMNIPDSDVAGKASNTDSSSKNSPEPADKQSTSDTNVGEMTEPSMKTMANSTLKNTPEESKDPVPSKDVSREESSPGSSAEKTDVSKLASLLEGAQPEVIADAPEEPETTTNNQDIMSLFEVENEEESPASLLAVDLFEVELDTVLKLSRDVSAVFKGNLTGQGTTH